MELIGKVIIDLPLESGVSKAGNNWAKKCWVVETQGQYPRRVKVDVFGENRINQMRVELNKTYSFQVDAESREFNGRWYTDLSAWAANEIESMPQGGMPGGQYAPQQPTNYAPQQPTNYAPQQPTNFAPQQTAGPVDPFASGASETDDLPF